MARPVPGHRSAMADQPDDERQLPTVDQPLNGPRRRQAPALLAVLGLVVAIALVLIVLTVVRYTT